MTHDKHVADTLDGLSSIELAGWIEYFKLKDERQTNQLIYAIVRAFNGDQASKTRPVDDDDEEIIDTTDPKFHEQFKGFINTKSAPQQSKPGRQQNTQIIMG